MMFSELDWCSLKEWAFVQRSSLIDGAWVTYMPYTLGSKSVPPLPPTPKIKPPAQWLEVKVKPKCLCALIPQIASSAYPVKQDCLQLCFQGRKERGGQRAGEKGGERERITI